MDLVSLESELIAWLNDNLSTGEATEVGLGDDAAVLRKTKSNQVVTTDLLSDGVDFLIDEVSPEQIGHKALGVNLSDLAAMAAVPQTAFVSLLLPSSGNQKHNTLELAIGLYKGLLLSLIHISEPTRPY